MVGGMPKQRCECRGVSGVADDSRYRERGISGFHVTGTPAVQPTIDDMSAKGVVTPWLRAQRHHVNVACKAQQRLVGAAADSSHQGLSSWRELHMPAVETCTAKRIAQWFEAFFFQPGWSDGFDAHKRLSQFHRT